jgi:hypothetical protein
MRSKKRDREVKKASNKVLLASVTKEMSLPRLTQSAQIIVDKQIKPGDREPSPCEIPPTEP